MDLQKLKSPIEKQLELLGYELVHLESVKEGRDSILRLYIDHLRGAASKKKVTLDDCVAANDGLVAWLDATFPDLRESMNLEISSPGMERPLTKTAHYHRFAGRLCRIQTKLPLNGQKRFKGWIGEATHEAVTIEEDGVLKTIPLEIIQKSRLAPFDEAKTPQPKHVVALRSELPDVHDINEEDGAETSARIPDQEI
ncbi:MAG: ribosome maturation factor RimP [Acidobacteriota bacterium]|nr:ribosome maturation factor RimP [Acidobacteriota bacterium]